MKPVLRNDAPVAVDFYSCGGGIKAGLFMAGFNAAVGIDKNPADEGLSHAYKWIQSLNYGEYGSVFHVRSIQEMADLDFPDIPRDPFILHASPSCKNYSMAKNLSRSGAQGETLEDITSGRATAKGIALLKPKYFTLECVPAYQKGVACNAIATALAKNNYTVIAQNVDMANYGVPQNRNRLFILASLEGFPVMKFPPYLSPVGWRQAISGLSLKNGDLTDKQRKKLAKYFLSNHSEDLLIERIGVSVRELIIRRSVEPCWTITTSIFVDDKNANRNHAITALIDGEVYALSMRAIARLCGFPDWYTLPNQASLAGSVLGNAVPPAFYAYLLRYNFPQFS